MIASYPVITAPALVLAGAMMVGNDMKQDGSEWSAGSC